MSGGATKSKTQTSAKWCGIAATASLVSLFVPPIGPIGMCASNAQGIALLLFLGFGLITITLLIISKVRQRISGTQI